MSYQRIARRFLVGVLVSLSTIVIAIVVACSSVATTDDPPKPATTKSVSIPTTPPSPEPAQQFAHPTQVTSTPTPTVNSASRSQEVATVTVQQLKNLLEGDDKPLLFDARSMSSYESGHIPGAISLPLDELEKRISEVSRDRLVIFYCTGAT